MSTLRAGVAKVCITPPVGTWQGGYGARDRPCEGIHDDLFARALVLDGGGEERAAVVSVDVVTLTHELTAEVCRRVEAATGIPADRLALCASHTHGGPATRAYGESGPAANDEYLPILVQHLAGAVAAASRAVQPVTVRLGRGRAGFNVNRRVRTAEGTVMLPNPAGAVERDVTVIRLDAAEVSDPERGGPASPTAGPAAPPLALLFTFTCHATAMGASNYLITADYPGAAAAFVERAYGGATSAHFLQGCAGNVRPNLTGANGAFRGASWPELARLGRELGGATMAAAEGAAFAAQGAASGPCGAAGATVLLPYAPAPSEAELAQILSGERWPDGRAVTEAERRWAGRAIEAVRAGGLEPGAQAAVHVFRLGSVWLVTLPGEIFVEIGWRVRDAVAGAAGVAPERVVVTAYADGNVGYVPTGAAMPEGGYEVTTWQRSGRPSGFAPQAEEILARTAAELAAGLR